MAGKSKSKKKEQTEKKDLIKEEVKELNDEALKLQELYDGFYIPGFHVHPSYVKESIEEVERMHKLGVNLVGELVPYLHGWSFLTAGKELYDILEVCDHYKMVVSIHAPTKNEETSKKIDEMVGRFKNMIFVGAHPCDGVMLKYQFDRMEKYENYYLDWSGGGFCFCLLFSGFVCLGKPLIHIFSALVFLIDRLLVVVFFLFRVS